jgi:hypothetical protein
LFLFYWKGQRKNKLINSDFVWQKMAYKEHEIFIFRS